MPYYGISEMTLYISNSYTSQATTSFSYPDADYAWPWNNNTSIKTVIILNTITPPNTSFMFNGLTALTTVQNIFYINTSNVTTMSSMFNKCSSLTSLDVSSWNTSKVTSMQGMFNKCSSLISLDVSSWNTSNVTTMRSMFIGCSSLTSLNVSSWNTSNVTSMWGMFSNACSLKTLNLNGWDVSKVTDMRYMFECDTTTSQLERIYCDKVWTGASGVQSDGMFNGCVALKGGISYDSSKLTIAYARPNTGYFTKFPKPRIGIEGKAKKAKSIYIGIGGKAKKVTKGYIGVNGKAKLIYLE